MRDDFYEISRSPIVQDPTVTTWIYYDHRENAREIGPLPNVVTPAGSVSGIATTKTQYLKWSHEFDAFAIEYVSDQEQDGDDPQTVYDFVSTAIEDCMSDAETEFVDDMEFIVVFASHAAGPLGFGGDDDPDRRRLLQQTRLLTQTNDELVTALQRVLDDYNIPSFDVIGFDACLMQAVGAVDDYRRIAKYVLASEAVEPGHGWSYQYLNSNSEGSALTLAQDIVHNYITQTQGHLRHLTPKTLSLVDTFKFTTFLQAFDTFCGYLVELLDKGEDPDILAHLHRARNQAIMFTSVVDLEGSQRPSAVDVGSYLKELKNSCRPTPNSDLARSLNTALALYDDMFVIRGVGEGTVAATGMHITFPVRSEYLADTSFFQEILWESNEFATKDAPQWLEFLQLYYDASPSTSNSEWSTEGPIKSSPVCLSGISNSIEVPEGQLIIQPRLSGITNGGHQLKTEISRETDWMLVEFGIDLTPLLDSGSGNGGGGSVNDDSTNVNRGSSDGNRHRQLQHRLRDAAKERKLTFASSEPTMIRPSSPALQTNSITFLHDLRTSSRTNKQRRRVNRHLQQQEPQERILQGSQDYFILFGGDVAGQYNQSNYNAFWNRQFYLLEDSFGNLDVLYGYDNGNGQKEVPVMYIPPEYPIASDDVPFGLTEQQAKTRFVGAEYGYLSFSLDTKSEFTLLNTKQAGDPSSTSPEMSLYTSDGATYSEKPRTAGGQILPVVYVEGQLDGAELDVLVGGFFSTVLEWSVENEMELLVTEASDYMDIFDVNYLVVDVLAVDDDVSNVPGGATDNSKNSDFTFFIIDRDGTVYIHDGGNGSSGSILHGFKYGTTATIATAVMWLLLY